MVDIPEFDDHWSHYNNFHFTGTKRQFNRIITRYEIYTMARDVPGEIVECGVFKGASFLQFAMFRKICGETDAKQLIGFDTFGEFPVPEYEPDKERRQAFVEEAGESITKTQLHDVLNRKDIENYDLVEGDINETAPEYVAEHPELRISLLNIDVDVYGATKTILGQLYPRVVSGGVILLDDYAKFPGETKAVNEYFTDKDVSIQRLQNSEESPYIVK
jgi:hypothetical protein